MATIDLYCYWETTIDGERKTGGSLSTPVSITIDGVVHDQVFSVANNGSQKLFDVDEDISDIDFLWIEANQTGVLLQEVVDDDGNNGEAYLVKTLTAGFPYLLGNDTALASNGSVDLFDGTSDVLERFNVKNSSGSTAKVRVVAMT